MVAEMLDKQLDTDESGRSRLRPFVFAERWRWIQAPPVSDGFDIEGFEAEVRVSLTNADLQAFRDKLIDLDTRRVEFSTEFALTLDDLLKQRQELMSAESNLSPKERDKRLERNKNAATEAREIKNAKEKELMRERFELAAPHIRRWNAAIAADNALGYEEVPPPAVGGAASLEVINPQMASWVTLSICDAWRLGKSLTGKLPQSSDTLALSQTSKAGPQVVSE